MKNRRKHAISNQKKLMEFSQNRIEEKKLRKIKDYSKIKIFKYRKIRVFCKKQKKRNVHLYFAKILRIIGTLSGGTEVLHFGLAVL